MILCRFAVPVFLYDHWFLLLRNSGTQKRELKQIGKIFTITIGANLFYLIWEDSVWLWREENNIKEALLARFEERVPEDFILWNFSPLFTTSVVSTGACVCAGDCIYCRTSRT